MRTDPGIEVSDAPGGVPIRFEKVEREVRSAEGSAHKESGVVVRTAKSSSNNIEESNAEDIETVRQVLGGDRQAFQRLVEKYQQRAYTIAFQILKRREDAQDVVQESFVKAYLSLAQFKGNAAFYTWLYRIVFNMSIDLKRKLGRRNEPAVSLDESQRDEIEHKIEAGTGLRIEQPLESVVRREQAQTIQSVLDSISEEHRSVIVLREVEGMRYEQIAQILGISKGTVMSRLHYARKRLQGLLRDLLFEPDEVRAGKTG